MTRTRYAVKFTNAHGKQCEVVVSLTEEEERDCARQAASHGCPDGRWPLLENTYAAQRAAAGMPAEFIEKFPAVERINLH
jgi:hypothetical protein